VLTLVALLAGACSSVAAFLRRSGDEAVLVVLNFDKESAAQVTLSANASGLAAGAYTPEPLLGDQPGAPLTVAAGGSIDAYAPLPTLEPRIGYIFRLRR
jgi:hypothetical protein